MSDPTGILHSYTVATTEGVFYNQLVSIPFRSYYNCRVPGCNRRRGATLLKQIERRPAPNSHVSLLLAFRKV